VQGCEGARVRGCKGARVRGCKGARAMTNPSDPTLSRRELLAAGAGAAAIAAVSSVTPAIEAATGRFFTPSELALVDELSEIVIPADEHSPGARAAKVAASIDARLAEAMDEPLRLRWRTGLAAVEALATSRHGRRFMRLTPAEREGVVAEMAKGEGAPRSDGQRFFVELKRWTVKAYYASRIGLHQEMEYKGNTVLAEYVGEDVRVKE